MIVTVAPFHWAVAVDHGLVWSLCVALHQSSLDSGDI